ncbi:MAG: serine hydrolase [Nitrospira sp.]|nr:serine hydrolase [Nitrospira sp.]MCP9441286.1 serine hydrolase [Nitrospira sp.]
MSAPVSLRAAMEQAVADGVFPGAVLAVRRGLTDTWLIAAGRLSSHPSSRPVSSATIYDLASLTKPLATVTAIALLVQEGRCRLDDPIESLLPELEGAAVGSATLRHLLTHSSGLPGWRGFYERLSPQAVLPVSEQERSRVEAQVLQLISQEPLLYERGSRSLYSDLGFMLLGMAVERGGGMRLDAYVRQRIAEPTGARPLHYLPTDQEGKKSLASLIERTAPTEWDDWRKRLLVGEVHDENAAALGGIAGHAGLFGTAEAVLAVSGAWLTAYHGRPSLLHQDVVREFVRPPSEGAASTWALGWETPSVPSSSGRHFSRRSFGHLGYTGTSIWIDPVSELEVVLLSNRVHPTRRNEKIRAFRPAIHDLVYQERARGVSG